MALRRSRAAVFAAALITLSAASAGAQSNHPRMDPDSPFTCLRDSEGLLWRVQCNETSKICLFAPDAELDASGNRIGALERARPCRVLSEKRFEPRALEAQGFTLKYGIPEAPYGWLRDERGRIMQVNFDLKRRMYIGGSYAPVGDIDGISETSRSAVDFGLLVLERFRDGRSATRHRLRLVSGEVSIKPFSADLVLAHYDLSHRFANPLLRITTFFGEPRRYESVLDVGVWAEAGGLEVHHTDAGDSSLWRFATTHATLDLWQSPRLYSYARIRAGVGIEGTYSDAQTDRIAVTGGAALEADWTLDRSGFHNLRAEVGYEQPRYVSGQSELPERAQRLRAGLQYEAIFLAINDQPLSLRLAAGGEKRDDIPGIPDSWIFTANAGLRFSLWAPPRKP